MIRRRVGRKRNDAVSRETVRVPALMRPGLPLESSLNVFLMSGSPLKRRAKSEFELSENSDESSTPRVFLSSVANEVNCKLQSTQRNILMRGRISLISRNPHSRRKERYEKKEGKEGRKPGMKEGRKGDRSHIGECNLFLMQCE